MRKGRRTHMTKLTVAFHYFVKAPKNELCPATHTSSTAQITALSEGAAEPY